MKMKKMLSAFCALAMSVSAFAGLAATASAEGGTATAAVKMTWVDYDNPDTAMGEIAAGETARSGYNKISGGSVGFAITGWGENKITYLQVDASAVDGKITKATLTAEVSGSSDGKRTTEWGVGYNSSVWSADMTYNTADRTITTVGSTAWTVTKSASTFENKSFDITEAIKNGEDGIVTILVYETQPAGGYIKNPAVQIEYVSADATLYNVTFAETNGVNATVKVNSDDVTDGTQLLAGTYTFTATAEGYEDYTGEFTVEDEDLTVEYTMVAKTPAASPIYVNYVYDGEVIKTEEIEIEGKYAGDAYQVPFSRYVLVDSKLYESTRNSSNPWYGKEVTLTSNKSVEIEISCKIAANDNVVLLEDLDSTDGENAGIRASNCSAYNNTAYTSETVIEPGIYTVIVGFQNKGRGSTLTIGDATVISYADYDNRKNTWLTETFTDVTVTEAGNVVLNAGSGKTRDCLDTIVVIKTGDIAPEIETAVAAPEYVTGDDGSYSAFTVITVNVIGDAPITSITYDVVSSLGKTANATWQVPDGVVINGDAKAGLIVNGLTEADETVEITATAN